MPKTYLIVALVFVAIFSYLTYGKNSAPQSLPATSAVIDRGNCLADDCLLVDGLEYPAGTLNTSVKSALDRALDDEYKAHATYAAIISRLGTSRPFSMIIGAEEQHIAQLKAIYLKYGETPIPDKYTGKVTSPSTIALACQAGVQAEIANAELYKMELLPQVREYSDITQVFTNLMNVSAQKHQPAFERCATR